MTTNLPVDPSDIKVSLEILVRRLEKIQSGICSLNVRDEKKTAYPVNCILHMLEAGRIPGIDELTHDDDGNIIISELDPDNLRMSSQDWESLGLPAMDEYCENVSMYGANLEDHQQAEKLKRAFVKFPPTLISIAIGEVYKKFEEQFQMTLFQSDAKQKYSPIQQMRPMQDVLLTIQTRCVNTADEMYKVCLNTCNVRPADMAELRKIEVHLRSQVQILE